MVSELSIRSSGAVRTVRLDQHRYMLGRLRSNDISFPDDGSLSKQHLAFEREGEGWVVVDLGSRNGTFVNGTRVLDRRRLEPGDIVRAGKVVVTFGVNPEDTVVFGGPEHLGGLPTTVRATLESALQSHKTAGLLPRGRVSPLGTVLQASRELVARRSAQELFTATLTLVMEAVGANRGVILSAEGGKLAVRATRGEGFRISTAVRDTVLREKTSLLVPDTSLDTQLRQRDSIVLQRVQTLMAVPPQTDVDVLGLIYLDGPPGALEWTADDLNLVTAMANIAALRLERERLQRADELRRLLETELHQAAAIQRGFLPADPPLIGGVDLAGYNSASHSVGGDYYDFFMLPDGRLGCVIADVAGKGMPAALLMVNLQARVHVLSETRFEPASFMTTLDRVVRRNAAEDRFITVFYCAVDPASGRVEYANAGHNPPLLVRRDGAVEWLREGGPVLGVLPGIQYDSAGTQMSADDVLVLYSDGVTEAMTPEDLEFGEARLAEIAVEHRSDQARDLLSAIHARVVEWCGDAPPQDDLTIVVVKKT
jgi:sigma-B regulation protein RsbU (phosphoserine phosphatase)